MRNKRSPVKATTPHKRGKGLKEMTAKKPQMEDNPDHCSTRDQRAKRSTDLPPAPPTSSSPATATAARSVPAPAPAFLSPLPFPSPPFPSLPLSCSLSHVSVTPLSCCLFSLSAPLARSIPRPGGGPPSLLLPATLPHSLSRPLSCCLALLLFLHPAAPFPSLSFPL